MLWTNLHGGLSSGDRDRWRWWAPGKLARWWWLAATSEERIDSPPQDLILPHSLFGGRGGMSGGQPNQSVYLSSARAHLEILERFLHQINIVEFQSANFRSLAPRRSWKVMLALGFGCGDLVRREGAFRGSVAAGGWAHVSSWSAAIFRSS